MPEPATLRLQRALTALVLEAQPPAEDAFGGYREDLLAYRDLVRMGLEDPVETVFPVTMACLEEDGTWGPCLEAFLEARCVPSRHHRDVAPAFLGWLADTGWGLDRWPWLLELAHFELLETLVGRAEDLAPPPGLEPHPAPTSRIVLDPATRVVAYTHAVHRATEEAPRPLAAATQLLAYRDGEGFFQLQELTPFTAALLVEAGTRSLGEVLGAMGVPDPSPCFALLENLREEGAIAGFRGILTPQ